MKKSFLLFITIMLFVISLFSCPNKATMCNVKLMAFNKTDGKYKQIGNSIAIKKGDKFNSITSLPNVEVVHDYKGRDYTFNNCWTKDAPNPEDAPLTEATIFNEDTTIQEDITLYAVYEESDLHTYTVTFNGFKVSKEKEANSRYEKISEITVNCGDTLNDISGKPTASDLAIEDFKGSRYAFVCWSETSPNPENIPITTKAPEFSYNTPITKDLTLYVVYSKGASTTRTVTFMGFEVGGESSGYKKLGDSITVEYGKTLNDISTKPTPIDLDDYKGFKYYFGRYWTTVPPTPESGPQTSSNFDNSKPIEEDLTFYAVYTKGSVNSRKVTFMGFKVGESSGYEQLGVLKTVDYGKNLNNISDRPTPSNITNYEGHDYTFRFWSKGVATGNKPSTTLSDFGNTTPIEEDITLYAVYTDEGENTYTVTFKSFNDNDNSYQSFKTKTGVGYKARFNNVKPTDIPEKVPIGGVEYTFLGWCEEQQPSSIIEHFQKNIIYDNPEITEDKTYCAVYIGDYLCFKAEEDGAQISFDFISIDRETLFGDDEISLQYRKDGDTEFKPYKWTVDGEQKESVKSAAEGLIITLSQRGNSVYFKGNNKTLAAGINAYLNFKIKNNKKVSASDSVMSLVNSRSVIPATNCFNSLFLNCSTLTEAPKLPATELQSSCYKNMFKNCKALTTAPSLPANSLTNSCYYSMFAYCENIQSVPSLSATELAEMCYYGMFYGCKRLQTAPDLLAEDLKLNCYTNMFGECSQLNSIKCYGKTGIVYSNLTGWLDGVASQGTFYCLQDVKGEWEYKDNSRIPSSWTVDIITAE